MGLYAALVFAKDEDVSLDRPLETHGYRRSLSAVAVP